MADIILTIGSDTRLLEAAINRSLNQKRKLREPDSKGMAQSLGRITGQSSEFVKSMEASNARVIAFGASAGMIFGVQSAFRSLVESTFQVEKSLTNINVLLNLSTSQLGGFSQGLFAVASSAGASFSDAAAAAAEFARQGLSSAVVLERTKDALVLSRLSGLDFEASVSAMTATLNSFQKEALTTTEVVDRMAAVDANFAVSSADLALAISRVGAAAESANVTLNETLAVVTAAQQITAAGGAKIGNAFKTIFTRLQRPQVLEQLEAIGVQTKSAEGNVLPLMQVLKNLANVYDLLTDSQRSYISEQIGSVYQINILKATMRDLGGVMSVYDRALKTAENAAGDADSRNEKLNKTLSSKLIGTLNAAQSAAAALGKTTIAPAMGGLLNFGSKIFGGISNVVESESDSMGNRFARGILAGIGSVISGPGIQAIVVLGIGLFKNLAGFVANSLKELGGANDKAREFATIQASVLGYLKQNPEILKQISDGTLSVDKVHQNLLRNLKEETVLLTEQARLAGVIAIKLSSSGVKVSGGSPNESTFSEGFIPRSNSGFVPNFSSEVSSARKLGATSGVRQVSGEGTIGGRSFIANNQETQIPNFGGSGETAVIPHYGGGTQKAIRMIANGQSGSILGKADGFIPNFVEIFRASKGKEPLGSMEEVLPSAPGRGNISDLERWLKINALYGHNNEGYKSGATSFSTRKLQVKRGATTQLTSFEGESLEDREQRILKQGSENRVIQSQLGKSRILNRKKAERWFEKGGSLEKLTDLSRNKAIGFDTGNWYGQASPLVREPRWNSFTEGEIQTIGGKGSLKYQDIGSGLEAFQTPTLPGYDPRIKDERFGGILAGYMSVKDPNKPLERGNVDYGYSKGFVPNFKLTEGFAPNFASPAEKKQFILKHRKISSGLGDEQIISAGKGSELTYTSKGKNLILGFNRSVERGAGFAQFSGLAEIAEKENKNIISSELIPQTARVEAFKNKTTNFDALRAAFPQLNHRMIKGFQTDGEYQHSFLGKRGDAEEMAFDFDSLSTIKKKINTPHLKRDKYNEGLVNSWVYLSDLTTKKVRGAGDGNLRAAFGGFVPNFSPQDATIGEAQTGSEGLPRPTSNRSKLPNVVKFAPSTTPSTPFAPMTVGEQIEEEVRLLRRLREQREQRERFGMDGSTPPNKARGFVPNLADVRKIEHYKSGELGEENRIVAGKGSSLRYIEDEERFSIDSHSSKNKGDGFAQFQELATLSHKSGKPIYSNSLSAQRNRLGLAQKRSTNFGALRAFYPQLDYRMIGGFVTEGDYAHDIRDLAGGPPEKLSLKFKSLADVKKKVDVRNIERDEYNNALEFDDVYLSRLTTKRIKEGPGDASLRNASKGFVPNLNSIKGRNAFQINWLKAMAKKRNLDIKNPDIVNKLAKEFAKTYPNEQGMLGVSKGFVPSFALSGGDLFENERRITSERYPTIKHGKRDPEEGGERTILVTKQIEGPGDGGLRAAFKGHVPNFIGEKLRDVKADYHYGVPGQHWGQQTDTGTREGKPLVQIPLGTSPEVKSVVDHEGLHALASSYPEIRKKYFSKRPSEKLHKIVTNLRGMTDSSGVVEEAFAILAGGLDGAPKYTFRTNKKFEPSLHDDLSKELSSVIGIPEEQLKRLAAVSQKLTKRYIPLKEEAGPNPNAEYIQKIRNQAEKPSLALASKGFVPNFGKIKVSKLESSFLGRILGDPKESFLPNQFNPENGFDYRWLGLSQSNTKKFNELYKSLNGGQKKDLSRHMRAGDLNPYTGKRRPEGSADAKGLFEKNFELIQRPNGFPSFSKGFIPNFASGLVPNFNSEALSSAISRENKAGIPLSEIRVGTDSSLATSKNPQSLGVFNEGEGSLKNGINLAKAAGINPKTKGASKGFIPNFNAPGFKKGKTYDATAEWKDSKTIDNDFTTISSMINSWTENAEDPKSIRTLSNLGERVNINNLTKWVREGKMPEKFLNAYTESERYTLYYSDQDINRVKEGKPAQALNKNYPKRFPRELPLASLEKIKQEQEAIIKSKQEKFNSVYTAIAAFNKTSSVSLNPGLISAKRGVNFEYELSRLFGYKNSGHDSAAMDFGKEKPLTNPIISNTKNLIGQKSTTNYGDAHGGEGHEFLPFFDKALRSISAAKIPTNKRGSQQTDKAIQNHLGGVNKFIDITAEGTGKTISKKEFQYGGKMYDFSYIIDKVDKEKVHELFTRLTPAQQAASGFVPNFNEGVLDLDFLKQHYNSLNKEEQGSFLERHKAGNVNSAFNEIAIEAKNKSIPRTIINGPAGIGKTTLAMKSGGKLIKDVRELKNFNKLTIVRAADADALLKEEYAENARIIQLNASKEIIKERREKRKREIEEGTSLGSFGRNPDSTDYAPTNTRVSNAIFADSFRKGRPGKFTSLAAQEDGGWTQTPIDKIEKIIETPISFAVGAFSPFHLGHEKLVRQADNYSKQQEIPLVIGVSKGMNREYDAGLTIKEKMGMIKKVFPDANMLSVSGYNLPSAFELNDKVVRVARGKSKAFVGSDRAGESTVAEKLEKSGFIVEEVSRAEKATSGTEVRKRIHEGKSSKGLVSPEIEKILSRNSPTIKLRMGIIEKHKEELEKTDLDAGLALEMANEEYNKIGPGISTARTLSGKLKESFLKASSTKDSPEYSQAYSEKYSKVVDAVKLYQSKKPKGELHQNLTRTQSEQLRTFVNANPLQGLSHGLVPKIPEGKEPSGHAEGRETFELWLKKKDGASVLRNSGKRQEDLYKQVSPDKAEQLKKEGYTSWRVIDSKYSILANAGKFNKGFVPNFKPNEIAEKAGAREHGYKAGRVFDTRIHDGKGRSFVSTVNSAEKINTVRNSSGHLATFVTPPNGYGEGTTFASKGFVPNFAGKYSSQNIQISIGKVSEHKKAAKRSYDTWKASVDKARKEKTPEPTEPDHWSGLESYVYSALTSAREGGGEKPFVSHSEQEKEDYQSALYDFDGQQFGPRNERIIRDPWIGIKVKKVKEQSKGKVGGIPVANWKSYFSMDADSLNKVAVKALFLKQRLETIAEANNSSLSFKVPGHKNLAVDHNDSLVVHYGQEKIADELERAVRDFVKEVGGQTGQRLYTRGYDLDLTGTGIKSVNAPVNSDGSSTITYGGILARQFAGVIAKGKDPNSVSNSELQEAFKVFKGTVPETSSAPPKVSSLSPGFVPNFEGGNSPIFTFIKDRIRYNSDGTMDIDPEKRKEIDAEKDNALVDFFGLSKERAFLVKEPPPPDGRGLAEDSKLVFKSFINNAQKNYGQKLSVYDLLDDKKLNAYGSAMYKDRFDLPRHQESVTDLRTSIQRSISHLRSSKTGAYRVEDYSRQAALKAGTPLTEYTSVAKGFIPNFDNGDNVSVRWSDNERVAEQEYKRIAKASINKKNTSIKSVHEDVSDILSYDTLLNWASGTVPEWASSVLPNNIKPSIEKLNKNLWEKLKQGRDISAKFQEGRDFEKMVTVLMGKTYKQSNDPMDFGRGNPVHFTDPLKKAGLDSGYRWGDAHLGAGHGAEYFFSKIVRDNPENETLENILKPGFTAKYSEITGSGSDSNNPATIKYGGKEITFDYKKDVLDSAILEKEYKKHVEKSQPNTSGSGYIPNFNSGISEAIKRESAAQSSTPIVEYSRILGGPAVYNANQKAKNGNIDSTIKKDHIARGQVPTLSNLRKTGSGRESYFSKGFVPNFSTDLSDFADMSVILGVIQSFFIEQKKEEQEKINKQSQISSSVISALSASVSKKAADKGMEREIDSTGKETGEFVFSQKEKQTKIQKTLDNTAFKTAMIAQAKTGPSPIGSDYEKRERASGDAKDEFNRQKSIRENFERASERKINPESDSSSSSTGQIDKSSFTIQSAKINIQNATIAASTTPAVLSPEEQMMKETEDAGTAATVATHGTRAAAGDKDAWDLNQRSEAKKARELKIESLKATERTAKGTYDTAESAVEEDRAKLEKKKLEVATAQVESSQNVQSGKLRSNQASVDNQVLDPINSGLQEKMAEMEETRKTLQALKASKGSPEEEQKLQATLNQQQEGVNTINTAISRGVTVGGFRQEQEALVVQGEERQKTIEGRKEMGKKASGIAMGVGMVGNMSAEMLFGKDPSDAKKALQNITSTVQKAAQVFSALPGPVGAAGAAFMIIGGAVQTFHEYRSGIQSLKKQFDLQKNIFVEMNAALTGYAQTVNSLSDSYGDPTVTQDTISRLNKKLQDSLTAIPNTPKGQEIKNKLITAGTSTQRLQIVEEAKDYMRRTEQRAEMDMAAVQRNTTVNTSQSLDSAGGFGSFIKLFGYGGGFSEGGSKGIYDKRNMLGGQTKAQAFEGRELLRKDVSGTLNTLDAKQMEDLPKLLSKVEPENVTGLIEQMTKLGFISEEMGETLLANADSAKMYADSLRSVVTQMEITKKVTEQMKGVRDKDLLAMNGIKLAAQAAEKNMHDLANKLSALNKIGVERQGHEEERSRESAATFGMSGGQVNMPNVGAPWGIRGMPGRPDMFGSVNRAAAREELNTAKLTMGAEGIARKEGEIKINEILETDRTSREKIKATNRSQLGTSVMDSIIKSQEIIVRGEAGNMTNQSAVDAQKKAGELVSQSLSDSAAGNLSGKESGALMSEKFRDTAIADSINALANKGNANPLEKKQLQSLNDIRRDLAAGKDVDSARITGSLVSGEAATGAYRGFIASGAEETIVKGIEELNLSSEKLSRTALEQLKVEQKAQIEGAKQRQIERDLTAGGGVGAFQDRKKEREIDTNIRRSATTFAMSSDPVRQGRAALDLASNIQSMAGGGMTALQGGTLQKLATHGNKVRIEAQADRQISILRGAMARATTPEKRAALQGSISTLSDVRARAGDIAKAQVENKLKLEEQPANIAKMTTHLDSINKALEKGLMVDIKEGNLQISKPIGDQIEKLGLVIANQIAQLALVMENSRVESETRKELSSQKGSALQMIEMARQGGFITDDDARKSVAAVESGDAKTISKEATSIAEKAKAGGLLEKYEKDPAAAQAWNNASRGARVGAEKGGARSIQISENLKTLEQEKRNLLLIAEKNRTEEQKQRLNKIDEEKGGAQKSLDASAQHEAETQKDLSVNTTGRNEPKSDPLLSRKNAAMLAGVAAAGWGVKRGASYLGSRAAAAAAAAVAAAAAGSSIPPTVSNAAPPAASRLWKTLRAAPKNPWVLGALAVGTAVVGAHKYFSNKKSDKTKEEDSVDPQKQGNANALDASSFAINSATIQIGKADITFGGKQDGNGELIAKASKIGASGSATMDASGKRIYTPQFDDEGKLIRPAANLNQSNLANFSSLRLSPTALSNATPLRGNKVGPEQFMFSKVGLQTSPQQTAEAAQSPSPNSPFQKREPDSESSVVRARNEGITTDEAQERYFLELDAKDKLISEQKNVRKDNFIDKANSLISEESRIDDEERHAKREEDPETRTRKKEQLALDRKRLDKNKEKLKEQMGKDGLSLVGDKSFEDNFTRGKTNEGEINRLDRVIREAREKKVTVGEGENKEDKEREKQRNINDLTRQRYRLSGFSKGNVISKETEDDKKQQQALQDARRVATDTGVQTDIGQAVSMSTQTPASIDPEIQAKKDSHQKNLITPEKFQKRKQQIADFEGRISEIKSSPFSPEQKRDMIADINREAEELFGGKRSRGTVYSEKELNAHYEAEDVLNPEGAAKRATARNLPSRGDRGPQTQMSQGREAKIISQIDTQISILRGAMARATTPEKRAEIEGTISALSDTRARAGEIAEAQIKNEQESGDAEKEKNDALMSRAQPVLVMNWPRSLLDKVDLSGRLIGTSSEGTTTYEGPRPGTPEAIGGAIKTFVIFPNPLRKGTSGDQGTPPALPTAAGGNTNRGALGGQGTPPAPPTAAGGNTNKGAPGMTGDPFPVTSTINGQQQIPERQQAPALISNASDSLGFTETAVPGSLPPEMRGPPGSPTHAQASTGQKNPPTDDQKSDSKSQETNTDKETVQSGPLVVDFKPIMVNFNTNGIEISSEAINESLTLLRRRIDDICVAMGKQTPPTQMKKT